VGGGPDLPQSGGSGGGGLIWVRGEAPEPAMMDISGGLSAKNCANKLGEGLPGLVDIAGPIPCPNLDGDALTSSTCGGEDCDDADPAIHPGSVETCDGVDNDCSATADDNLPSDACAVGLVCQMGQCVGETVDGGIGPDGGATAPLQSFNYEGGCQLGSSASDLSLVALVGLSGLLGTRRRVRNREKLARGSHRR
jgi:putative metal-binding protein